MSSLVLIRHGGTLYRADDVETPGIGFTATLTPIELPKPQLVPDLSPLLHDPSHAASVPAESIPALLGQLAALQAILFGRLVATGQRAPEPESDRLLPVEEAARLLACSVSYLYHHSKRFPFAVREGHRLLFSYRGIQRYMKNRQGR